MQSDLQNRVVYRSTPGVIRFAWRVIILSVLMTAFIFLLIPLTSKMGKVKEDLVVVRKVPTLVKFDEPEEIFDEPLPTPEQKPEVQELEMLLTPPTPPPPALSVKLNMALQPTSVQLHVDNNFKKDMTFEVEKITAVAAKNPLQPKIITKVAPAKVRLPAIDYDGIFSENQVDEKALRTRYVPPSYPMRARRRNLSGKVVISCVITKEGRVATPEIIKAYPQGYFEKSCLSILPKLEYKAAQKDGRPVVQRTILTFEFGLRK